MGDLIRRRIELLEHFEKKADYLKSAAELKKLLTDTAKVQLTAGFEPQAAWAAIRFAYRRELLQLAIYDLSQDSPQDGLPQIAAALADLAGAMLEAALLIGRAELSVGAGLGGYDPAEVEATKLAVIAMGKTGARELNYISDVDVIFVADTAGLWLRCRTRLRE